MHRLVLSVLLLAATAHPLAQERTVAPVASQHTLNLKGADIGVLIQTVSEITGRSFIVDPRVEARVTVISSAPQSVEQIWETFTAVLRVHGFAVVPAGGMWKVVPEAAALGEGPTLSAAGPDALVTRVIALRQTPADELANLLRPLLGQGAQVAGQGGNLVVTDRASNVERVARLVERIDAGSGGAVEVVALRHANAAEIARTLAQLEPAATPGLPTLGGSGRLVADARSNSVLISGDATQRLRLRTLVAHLDTPLAEGGDSTQVIYLRHAKAIDLVPLLESVAATLTGTAANAEGARAATIGAHEETNALVVTAAPPVFRELAAVVRQLDVRRAQVLVEAVIAEVSDELADQIGVQWQSTSLGNNPDGSLGSGVIGGTNFPGQGGAGSIIGAIQNPLGALGSAAGLNIGYVDGTVNIPGPNGQTIRVAQMGALIRALRGDGRANILSRPSVITLDHTEAEFKVAQEVPFLTGRYTSTAEGGSSLPGNPFQTIERRDVGLILTVTPHVNEGDAVRLDLRQELSSLSPGVAGAVDLITNKREIRTSVLVPDGGMIVLGGLDSDELRETIQGVPGLSRIPLLGNLFKSRDAARSKSSLMVFLRPQILRDAATEAAVSTEKYNFLRTQQLEQQYEHRSRGGPRPLLPADPATLFQPGDAVPVQPVPVQPGEESLR
ncbi:type II secretion system secretin GspD [Coralloluteibacterium thermophilus]|uniref:Type II secretion system secretin GspD n=1 Tax=Coralloluteibacterium thermophilum TaxID=2707049 RepID=A0ABV9NE84_9GAMM